MPSPASTSSPVRTRFRSQRRPSLPLAMKSNENVLQPSSSTTSGSSSSSASKSSSTTLGSSSRASEPQQQPPDSQVAVQPTSGTPQVFSGSSASSSHAAAETPVQLDTKQSPVSTRTRKRRRRATLGGGLLEQSDGGSGGGGVVLAAETTPVPPALLPKDPPPSSNTRSSARKRRMSMAVAPPSAALEEASNETMKTPILEGATSESSSKKQKSSGRRSSRRLSCDPRQAAALVRAVPPMPMTTETTQPNASSQKSTRNGAVPPQSSLKLPSIPEQHAPAAATSSSVATTDLLQRMQALFGDVVQECRAMDQNRTPVRSTPLPSFSLQQQPCLSARLFAAFSLKMDQKQSRSNGTSTFSPVPSVSRLLPLIKAMVAVEVVDLWREAATTDAETDSASAPPTALKTTFCAYDGSWAVSTIDGRFNQLSGHYSECVQALCRVQQELVSLLQDDDEQRRDEACRQVQTLLQFFGGDNDSKADPSSSRNWISECATSIHQAYPVARVRRAMNFYQHEFQVVLKRLQQQRHQQHRNPTPGMTPTTVPVPPIDASSSTSEHADLELRLAHVVGQAIRYQLRRSFQKPLPRFCKEDVDYDSRADSFSKVFELVDLYQVAEVDGESSSDDDGEEELVDDERIPSFVSQALLRLHEYFGMELLRLWKGPTGTTKMPTTATNETPCGRLTLTNASSTTDSAYDRFIPELFCSQPASNLGFRSKTRSKSRRRHVQQEEPRGGAPSPSAMQLDEPLTEDQLEEVLDDVHQATGFLAASRAGRFLVDLLSVPGVQDEIARQGGWAEAQDYASLSWKYELFKLCPEDAHLVLLSNIKILFDNLQSLLPQLEACESCCRRSLEALGERYHVATQSKALKKKFPQIDVIESHYGDGLERANDFPSVRPKPPEEEEEEEENDS